MNEYKKKEQAEEMEIDVQELVSELWDKMWYLLVSAVMGAVAAFLITFLLITPLFQSSAMFYVNNSSLSVGDATFSIDSGDISASKSLVDSYIVILKTRESLNDVIDYSGVNRTYEELRSMISAASVNSTEIFEVVVTSPDPAEAEQIAKAIAYILPKRISSIIEGTSAKIVDSAVKATTPSSPSYTMNVLAGFAIGFALAAVFVMLQKLFDITIRSEEDIAQCCDHPVLASVPDMDAPSKGGYYYGAYGQEAAK
jgi:capsular polysaccharide biosynthesis protein